jgi:hypothetical protein
MNQLDQRIGIGDWKWAAFSYSVIGNFNVGTIALRQKRPFKIDPKFPGLPVQGLNE